MFSDYVSAYKLLNDVGNLSRSKSFDKPKVEQQFELGIAFPCKVDNFSVLEMENDVNGGTNRVVVEQHSREERHLLKVIQDNRQMSYDAVNGDDQATSESSDGSVIDPTSIKFEIQYGSDSNCYFDSTQIEAFLNPDNFFRTSSQTSCWVTRRENGIVGRGKWFDTVLSWIVLSSLSIFNLTVIDRLLKNLNASNLEKRTILPRQASLFNWTHHQADKHERNDLGSIFKMCRAAKYTLRGRA